MDIPEKAPSEYSSEVAAEVLRKLAEAGRLMTAEDHLEQMRGVMYGTPEPDPETRKEVDEHMRKYYGV